MSQRLLAIAIAIILTACGKFEANEKMHERAPPTVEQTRELLRPRAEPTRPNEPNTDTPLEPQPETQPEPQPEPQRQSGQTAFWDDEIKDGKKYTQITANAIDELGPKLLSIVPRDIKDFCPKYETLNTAERKSFWIQFTSALAAAESSFDTKAYTATSVKGSRDPNKLARGLLQLSFDSVLAYGCPVETFEDLHDPKMNLECGVRMMNWWIERDAVMTDRKQVAKDEYDYYGIARYWEPMRAFSKKLPVIKDAMKKTDVCKD